MVKLMKVAFIVLGAGIIILGVVLAVLGFYGPSLREEKKGDDYLKTTEEFAKVLGLALYVTGVMGLVVIAVGVVGLLSFNIEMKLLTILFRICIVIVALILLALAGVAIGSVVFIKKTYAEQWRPVMKKFDTSILKLLSMDNLRVHLLQLRYNCCGLSGEDVYEHMKDPPVSCCVNGPGKHLTLEDVPSIIHKAVLSVTSCSKELVASEGKPGCDEAANQPFIFWGKTVAGVSLLSALYCLGVMIFTCCCGQRQ